MKLLSHFLIVFFVCIAVLDVSAQNKRVFKGQYHRGKYEPKLSFNNIKKNELLSVYLLAGFSWYSGDLCDGFSCIKPRPQFGGGALYRTGFLNKRLNIRLEGHMFRLYSDDVFESRNLNFRSTNWEGWVGLQFDMYPYEKLLRRRTLFNPYAYFGVGFVQYDPWGLHEPTDKWHQLRNYETQGYNIGRYTMSFPMGIGTRYKINYKWTLMADIGFRFTLTDQMDDVHEERYSDPSTFTNSFARYFADKSSDGLGFANNRQRGSSKYYDIYYMFNIGVMYTFTNKHQTKVRGRTHLLRK